MRRVVITGVGMVTPLASETETTWQGLLEGRSAVGQITSYDPSALRTHLGAEIVDFEPERYIRNRKSLRMMPRVDRFAFAAAAQAAEDAGWSLRDLDGERGALYSGGGKEICDPDYLKAAILASRSEDGQVDECVFAREALDSAYPLFYVEGLPGAILYFISEAFQIEGANAYFAGTAEAGAVAIGTAFRTVRRGEADYALAGGADDPVSWWTMSKMDAAGMLTDRNSLGASACRPFDAGRSGSVMGEGAAYVAMETEASARARGARIYAEVVGFGSSANPRGLMTPDREGREVGLAIRGALREAAAELGFSETILIGHGSGTRLGDPSEVRGIRSELGPQADFLVGSSVKASAGHLGAGAGALNVAVAAKCLERRTVPPSLNLEDPDPECELDWVRGSARAVNAPLALALARGLEGQCSALLLRSVA